MTKDELLHLAEVMVNAKQACEALERSRNIYGLSSSEYDEIDTRYYSAQRLFLEALAAYNAALDEFAEGTP
jgi:hypothetical protein